MGNSPIITKVENGVDSVYHGISNDVDSVVKAISSVPATTEHVVDQVVQTGGNVLNHVVDTGGSIIKGGELTIFIPLALIGLGAFFLLKNSNPNTISEVSRSAIVAGV